MSLKVTFSLLRRGAGRFASSPPWFAASEPLIGQLVALAIPACGSMLILFILGTFPLLVIPVVHMNSTYEIQLSLFAICGARGSKNYRQCGILA